MNEEIPRVWWLPDYGVAVESDDHIEALESHTYFYEVPADAVELKADPEDLKVKKAEALRKVQQETLVALFDGDTQVTDWAPFAEGKAPVFDNWLDPRREHEQYHAMNQMTMRTQDGNKVRASTSVQEKVTKSYAITWRTTW